MRRWSLYVGLVLILLFTFLITGCQPAKTPPVAKDGLLDLTEWDFEKDGNINLNGEWEFYWGKLLEPNDFKEEILPSSRLLMEIPTSWNSYKIKGKELGGRGYATSRLIVKLPDSHHVKAIRVPPISTAHKLWINGELVSSQGVVSTTLEQSAPKYYPQIVELPQQDGTLELIVQVSNFFHRRGGIWQPLLLGESRRIHLSRDYKLVSELILFSFLLVIGLYQFIFYVSRKRDKSPLYFGAFCVLIAIRILLVGEMLLLHFFPKVPQEAVLKTEYLTFYLGIPLFLQYIYTLFPEEQSAKVCLAYHTFALANSLIVLVTPARIYSQLLYVFDVATILVFISIFYALILATRRKREGAKVIIGGALFLIFTAINDILFYGEKAGVSDIFPLGVLVFIFSQSFMLLKRFANAYKTIEQMKDRLVSLDKLKDEFLANVSHELLTPLNGMIGIAESMLETAASLDDKQKNDVYLIASSGKRLTGLVRDILDFSKLKHKDIVLYKKSVDLKQVVKIVINLCQPLVMNKQLDLYYDLPDNLFVEADESRLEQILYNLVGNAIKYTNSGRVVVTATKGEKFVEVAVKDTGIGIPKDYHEKIFNSYEQLYEFYPQGYGGVGLGLTITKELVELHGGSIKIESEENRGSTISFTLPLASAKNQQVKPYTKVEANYKSMKDFLKKSRRQSHNRADVKPEILVVDDELINQQVLYNQLEGEGYIVTCSSDGLDALQKIRENAQFDLIILDIMMPGKSGYEVCRIVRQEYSLVQLPILMLTVRDSEEDITEAFEAGANDYLAKPFNKKEMLARVKTLLTLKKTMNEVLSSEMRFLQAQIKPHFLYNTINTIMGFCRKDPDKARKLLDELSCYLRGKFRFNELERFVLLTDELDIVKAYLNIENARFGARLKVIYNLKTETNYQIPPLIIQPIVENAVRHGIQPKKEGGTVEILVEEQKGRLVITIKDDGVGMSQAKLAQILKGQDKNSGIGLKNVDKRLKNYYGQGLTIASEIDKGTSVTITIPKTKGRESQND